MNECKDQVADTICYNSMVTIGRKTKLAMQQASGIMIWQLTEDADGKKSLLKVINTAAHDTDCRDSIMQKQRT